MNLDEQQKWKIAEWIDQGMKLSEIQSRLASEIGIHMTYMDVRLLVNDLKLTPKDPDIPAKIVPSTLGSPAQTAAEQSATKANPGISVATDQIARPGTIVSGKVTFSDNNKADWYLDQTGRLGLIPQQTGYRPSPGDLQQFQMTLEAELSKLGL